MQQKSKIKIVITICIFFFVTLFATRLFAAEYSRIYEFGEPNIITLSNGKQLLNLKGTHQKDDIVGAPILPVKTSKIFMPADEKVISIDIDYGPLITIEGSYLIQHGITPHPLSFKGQINVDKPAPSIYETNALYPPYIYGGMRPQFLHGIKIVMVDLMPVLYNPFEGQLKYYEWLEVKAKTAKQKIPEHVIQFKNSNKDRKRILRTIENKDDFLMRYPDSELERPTKGIPMAESNFPSEGTRQYVVITTDDLAPAFEILTNHRASSKGGGYTTHIEYIDNIDSFYTGVDLAEKMRNFIRDMYINHGTQYVLLGGDSDGSSEEHVIPTRGCYAQVGDYTDSNIPCDLYFGCLDGSWNSDGDDRWGELNDGIEGGDIDWLSEVNVGRIPADDYQEAMNHINKIIAFETGSGSSKTLLAGEKLDDETWGGDRMDWVSSNMGPTPKTELYDRDWENHSWPYSQLLAYINSNKYYWVNHSGHSSVVNNIGLHNDDVFSMINKNYFFVYSQGCYSGSIDGRYSDGTYGITDSFGESITNGYSKGGAFAYIGNSRFGWYTPGSYVKGASNRAHKEFVETIFAEDITKIGDAHQKSKINLPLHSGLYRWIAFETTLLGCPATNLVAQYSPDSDGGGGSNEFGCFIDSLKYK